MYQKISKYIAQNNLLSPDGLHLVALSGGADSVALLRILLSLGYKVEAMHCNFNLRGSESNRDEDFCRSLCSSLNVPLHIVHFDTRSYASMHHISIEMAARDLRYNYFRQLHRDLNASSICVAHHKDDSAETLLMNIIRGTGIQGLTAIRPRNGIIIRPLLCVSRHEIEDHLSLLHQPYVTDSSNLIDDVTRNKIRLDIMPLLKSINPSVIEALSSTAQHVNDALPFLNECIEHHKAEVLSKEESYEYINISKLLLTPSPRYLLFAILSERGFSPSTIDQIAAHLDSQTGTSWSCGEMVAVIDRNRIIIAHEQPPFHDLRIPICGNYALSDGKHLSLEELSYDPSLPIERDPDIASFDASTVVFPLTLRTVRQGDRFTPFGMRGSKLVSDFLTDRKLSILQKQRQLCLVDASGQILWLVSQRINNKNRITSDTIKLLRVRYY